MEQRRSIPRTEVARQKIGRRPKSGQARQVPLHPELRPLLLEGWRRRCPTPEDDALVFPVQDGDGVYAPDRLVLSDVRGGPLATALRQSNSDFLVIYSRGQTTRVSGAGFPRLSASYASNWTGATIK